MLRWLLVGDARFSSDAMYHAAGINILHRRRDKVSHRINWRPVSRSRASDPFNPWLIGSSSSQDYPLLVQDMQKKELKLRDKMLQARCSIEI